MKSPFNPRWWSCVFLVGLLSACAGPGNVPFNQLVNFSEGPANSQPAPLYSSPKDIAASLQKGGYIIYMRHGRTRYDQLELERNNRIAGKFDINQCETQRQLSDEGRAELKFSGSNFRATAFPIEKSFSSQYCRAKESAAFFVDGATAVLDLSGEGEFGTNPAIKGRVQAFLAQRPAPGKNIFMMAHGGIFWLATGWVIQEGHAVVLDPSNPQVIVARIGPQEWGAVGQAR